MVLPFLALAFPNIDPVLIELGPLAIRWYSLAYLVGIVGGWWCVGKLNARIEQKTGKPLLSAKAYEDIVTWVILGIVLGGRLGYVLLYQPEYYAQRPLEILQVWHGGMSFHGGFLGTLVAMGFFCRKYNIAFFRIMDVCAVVTPIGLCLGRLANFVNGELYGRVSDVPWAVMFPSGGYFPRHPSQLYEAMLEGVLLLAILSFVALKTRALLMPRLLSGLFLIGYGFSRVIVECFREPDQQLGFIFSGITMGQLLSVPMVLVGIYLVYKACKTELLV